MNVLISKDEYQELRLLRNHYEIENNNKSVKSMKKLENDIDLPIRTIVGMFGLLGCCPKFSCCGFDYKGQPIHKTHEYGNAYVMLDNNYNTEQIIDFLVEKKLLENTFEKTSHWRTWKIEKDKVVFVALAFDWWDSKRDYPWTKTNCIHYAEKGVIGLYHLRKLLYGYFRDSLLNKILLQDTNKQHNKNLAYWQYPVLEPWEINKEELLVEIQDEIKRE